MHLEIFPESFDFYTYGRIEKNKSLFDHLQTKLHVLFSLRGDENSIAVVCFNEIPAADGLTEEESKSFAVELANTLVSKFVNQVAEIGDETIYISAPEILDEDPIRNRNLLKLIQNELLGEHVHNKNARVLRQNYYFKNGPDAAPTQIALLLLKSNEGHG